MSKAMNHNRAQFRVQGRETVDYRARFQLPDAADRWLAKREKREKQKRQQGQRDDFLAEPWDGVTPPWVK